MFREILSLLEQEVAEPEDIDAGVTERLGFRLAVLGPLKASDMTELDLLFKEVENLSPYFYHSIEVPKVLKEKIDRGELGLKTIKGFFQYEREDGSALLRESKDRDKKLVSLLNTLSQ
jgi:3-hydroxybutyryl-CoA dehydrogenase